LEVFIKRKNANEIIYDEVTLLGIPAMLTDWRVDRASLPAGVNLYELRHADEDWGAPCQLARGIFVNFYGTLLTTQPIHIPESGYLDFESSGLVYVDDDACATLDEFLAKNPVQEAAYAQYRL
jgi:hypothetical protein